MNFFSSLQQQHTLASRGGLVLQKSPLYLCVLILSKSAIPADSDFTPHGFFTGHYRAS